jgi:hypothetical protein
MHVSAKGRRFLRRLVRECSPVYNSYDTNFDAPYAHFDNLYLFIDAQAENIRNPKCFDGKDP